MILTFLFVCGFNAILFVINSYRGREQKWENTLINYEDTVQSLIDANVNLQENITREIRIAENNERKRIAREMHDILGHSMVNIIMISESLKDKIKNNREVSKLLDLTREQAENVLNDTENSIYLLKSMKPERKYDMIAIKRLVDIFQKATGIIVVFELRNVPFSFGNKVNRVVYRIIQECMTNAFRHGKASEITILFWQYEKEIEITIMDNGVGNKQVSEGIGLWGIRERLSGINGSLQIITTDIGFKMYIRFPWEGVN